MEGIEEGANSLILWVRCILGDNRDWNHSTVRSEIVLRTLWFHRPRIVFGIYPVCVEQVVDSILISFCLLFGYIDFNLCIALFILCKILYKTCLLFTYWLTILRQSSLFSTVNRLHLKEIFVSWFTLLNLCIYMFILTFVAGQVYLVMFITKEKKNWFCKFCVKTVLLNNWT